VAACGTRAAIPEAMFEGLKVAQSGLTNDRGLKDIN
jgi:hypothetical protein